MSAWVATRTTRSGFFSLPPKAGDRVRTGSERGPPSGCLSPRWGGVSWRRPRLCPSGWTSCLKTWGPLPAVHCNLWAWASQQHSEPIFWASRKAVQKWARTNHRTQAASQSISKWWVKGDLTSDQGVALYKTKECLLKAVTPQTWLRRETTVHTDSLSLLGVFKRKHGKKKKERDRETKR